MTSIVIDTNVLISAVLSENSKPSQVFDMVSDHLVIMFYCSDMLDEYRRVLGYSKLKISEYTQQKIINGIFLLGIRIVPVASGLVLSHEPDRVFYDTAKTAEAILVTGNTKHFPSEPTIMSPSDFLDTYGVKAT